MADTILTLVQLENLFHDLAMSILGVTQDKIRIAYEPVGMPTWKRTEDITFISVMNIDDPYNQQRDIEYKHKDSLNATANIGYTRAHMINFVLYGPNSFDNADKLKNGLFLPSSKTTMNALNVRLRVDVPTPQRAPELFNGQWWERSDFFIVVYEAVNRQSVVPYIQTLNIQTKKG